MNITYILHSCFLIETPLCYYIFDYEKGHLPQLDISKPTFVLSSHGHHDHYNPEIFELLKSIGMHSVYAILSDDISIPLNVDVLQVSPGNEYKLSLGQELTTFASTDMGVAFLIEDEGKLIYHAGDLNDWVWEGEDISYNEQMTKDYRKQIHLLAEKLNGREIDAAFVVLDPRQEKDYDRGMCYFLEHVPVKSVYPMHYWGQPEIIDTFLKEHPEYKHLLNSQDEYAAQAKASWGKTDAYKEYEKKSEGRSETEQQKLNVEMMNIFAEFGKIKHLAPDCEEAIHLAKKLQDHITEHYYTCTDKILLGLSTFYTGGGDITTNIDQVGGEGTAVFAHDAIQAMIKKRGYL